jgi:hypothetical protein
VQVSPQTVAQGQPATVTGTGFPAGLPAQVQLFSDPVLLATVVPDLLGAFRTVVVIPADTPLGTHTIVVTTVGGTARAQVPITVTAAGLVPGIANLVSQLLTPIFGTATLVRTGSDVTRAARLALLLLAAGSVLLVLAWRSEARTAFPARGRRGRRWPYRSDRQVTGGPAATVAHEAPASCDA